MSATITLAERWFRPRAFERDGRLFRWLGVVLFKRLLMRLVQVDPANRKTNGYVLGGRSLADLREYERLARRSELIHVLGLILALACFALTIIWGGLLVAGTLIFAANFHCFLLQRYNRVRVYRILQRA